MDTFSPHLENSSIKEEFKLIIRDLLDNNEFLISSVDCWTNKNGDKMVQLMWKNVGIATTVDGKPLAGIKKESSGFEEERLKKESQYSLREERFNMEQENRKTSTPDGSTPNSKSIGINFVNISPVSHKGSTVSSISPISRQNSENQYYNTYNTVSSISSIPGVSGCGVWRWLSPDDKMKHRAFEEKRARSRRLREIKDKLSRCKACTVLGFCKMHGHKKLYRKMLQIDLESQPTDQMCNCNICRQHSDKKSCVFHEMLRLIHKKRVDCHCMVCSQNRFQCLQEEIRLLRIHGLEDVTPFYTGDDDCGYDGLRRGTTADGWLYAIEYFSTLPGRDPLEWILHSIKNGL